MIIMLVIKNVYFGPKLCRLVVLRNSSSYMKDQIGAPEKLSNLRPIKFAVLPNETLLQEKLRSLRQETQIWNQEFWSKHNTNFNLLKNEYIERQSKDGKESCMSGDEMGVFYKKFLDENYDLHKKYNKEWYKRNLTILWLTIKTKFEKFTSS